MPVVRPAGPRATLRADVCVIGSGAGGGVIAAELARGRPLGARARARRLPQRVGLPPARGWSAPGSSTCGAGSSVSESGSVGLLAGSTLGGGTVVNSIVCLRPPESVRLEWAALGLDRHRRPGLRRAPRRGRCADQRQHRGDEAEPDEPADGRGARAARPHAAADPAQHAPATDPRYCGYCNAGCQQGCKQSTLVTYLPDAAAAGARLRRRLRGRARPRRGRPRGGRPGTHDRRGRGARRADRRGADGGRRRGRDRVARAPAPLRARRPRRRQVPPPPSDVLRQRRLRRGRQRLERPVPGGRVSFDFADALAGSGFLVESVGLSLAFWAACSPFSDGASHKEGMLQLRHVAPWHAITHDHGSGEVVLGADGEAIVRWELGRPARPGRRGARAGRARAPAPRPRRARDLHLPLGRPPLARRRRLRRLPRPARGGTERPHRLLGAPDGRVPARRRSGHVRRRRLGPAARHAGRLDRRRLRAADGARRQPDADDHGARAPHGARDSRRRSADRRARKR